MHLSEDFSRQCYAPSTLHSSAESVSSMPGFLKVYGYYSPELKKWNIDVCFPFYEVWFDWMLMVLLSQLFNN
jgi:hypothetical protein